MRASTASAALLSFAALSQLAGATYTWQPGQSGYNGCDGMDGQSSMCQTVVMNSIEDFCLFAPPTPNSDIGNSERIEVAWCTQSGHGTRVIPQGTIQGAHWVETPNYIQVTGVGNFVNINIAAGDEGGELDPHGADGNGNPIGGIVLASGTQISEWTTFIAANEFCFRFCKAADDAWLYCQHIYDLEGCAWNEPGDYSSSFDSCEGDSVQYPGVYVTNGVTSTYFQGTDENHPTPAPPAHPAGKTSNCQHYATISGGAAAAVATSATSTTSTYSASSSDLTSSSSYSSSSSDSPSSSSSSYSSYSSYSSSQSSSSLSSASSSSSLASSSSISTSTLTSISTSTITASSTTTTSSSTKSSASGSASSSVKVASAAKSGKTAGGLLLAVAGGVALWA